MKFLKLWPRKESIRFPLYMGTFSHENTNREGGARRLEECRRDHPYFVCEEIQETEKDVENNTIKGMANGINVTRKHC